MTEGGVSDLLKSIFSEEKVPDFRALFEEKLNQYNISKTKALKLLKIDKDVFEQILDGTAKQPNLIHVVKIAEFLEVEINSFIKAVLNQQSAENIKSMNSAREATFILKNFDVKALTKLGFFEKEFDTSDLVTRILNFFGYSSIEDYEGELVEPLFSRTKRNFSDKMKDFWVKSAYQTFSVIRNPNDYDREELKKLIPKIKPYSQDINNGLFTVCRALYNIGVTVIFQDYLSTTQVRGGTFIIDGKPCIVITDFNKKYPTMWFTLMHELHHVLFDFSIIETNSFHLTGDDDLFLIEDKANAFARDYFLPDEKYRYIKPFINNAFLVSKFAGENEIHPSLVYVFYTWYQNEYYGDNTHWAFKEHYPDFKRAIERLNPVSWNDTSIKERSEKIKSILEIN